MKKLLLLCLLLGAPQVWAQTTSTETDGAYSSLKDKHYEKPGKNLQQEPAPPQRGATAIIIHTTDSAATAYKKAAQSFLSSGYMLDKADKELGFLNTKSKAIGSAYGLMLQAATASTSTGADIVFSGQFTWASAVTIVAKTDKREIPVTYAGKGGSPAQKMWAEMLRIATMAYPGATITYR